jgi:Rrf2 family iron-sulfur cluster assembly transcriptional regulator
MRMSTKGRFAVNAMIDLALREASGPVALATISARQQVSLSYLEQLFSRLRRQGLVESTRGPGGGYTLGRKAEDISVADIMMSVDDPMDSTDSDGSIAERGAANPSRDLWRSLNKVMLEHLATITLRSLVEEQQASGLKIEERPAKRAITAPPAVRRVITNAPNSVFAFGRSFER